MLGMPTLLEFKSIEENVNFAIDNKLDFVELNYNMPYVKNNLITFQDKRIRYSLHFYDDVDLAVNDKTIAKAYIKSFKSAIKKCRHLNLISVNVHLNVGPYTTINGIKEYNYKYDSNFVNRIKNTIIKLNNFAKKEGVVLTVENIKTPPFIITAFEELIKLGIKITYDLGHDMVCERTFFDVVNSNSSSIQELHLHDYINDDCHLPLGKGELDLQSVFGLTKGKNVVLEVKESTALSESIAIFKKVGEQYE